MARLGNFSLLGFWFKLYYKHEIQRIFIFIKTFELNILIHLKLFNKTFLYQYQNNFSLKLNKIYSKYLYSGYRITNSVQLGGTLQMSDWF